MCCCVVNVFKCKSACESISDSTCDSARASRNCLADVEIVEILMDIESADDDDDGMFRKANDNNIIEYQSSIIAPTYYAEDEN